MFGAQSEGGGAMAVDVRRVFWSVWYAVCLCFPSYAVGGTPEGEATAGIEESGQRPLQFGLLPYVSTRKLFTYYLPIKEYLERSLGRKVVMSTAPDFKTYLARARAGEYDLYHTAPHFAALAERDWGYRRVSRLTRELDGSFVVAKDGSVMRIEDLRGTVVRVPDPLAIVTMLGEHTLREHGLKPGVDVDVRFSPSHNNAVLAVARGEAAAAVTSAAVFEKMEPEVRDKLHVLTGTSKVPHMMFMAGPRLSDGEYLALRNAMLAFTASGEGKAFFQETGYGDMVDISDTTMDTLAPFLDELAERSQE